MADNLIEGFEGLVGAAANDHPTADGAAAASADLLKQAEGLILPAAAAAVTVALVAEAARPHHANEQTEEQSAEATTANPAETAPVVWREHPLKLVASNPAPHADPEPVSAAHEAEPAAPAAVVEPSPPVSAATPDEALVASAARPLEPAPEPAQTATTAPAAPPPVVAPIAVAAAPALAAAAVVPPRSPSMTESPVAQAEPQAASSIDPFLAGFDHLVALAGYVLLFISVFTLGVPALAALALAFVHKGDTHLLARTHFRFQLRIIGTALVFLLLAVGAFVAGAGASVRWLFNFAETHVSGLSGAMTTATVGAVSGKVAALLVGASLLLALLASVLTLVSSAFGFLRLLANKPIGHLASKA